MRKDQQSSPSFSGATARSLLGTKVSDGLSRPLGQFLNLFCRWSSQLSVIILALQPAHRRVPYLQASSLRRENSLGLTRRKPPT